MDFSIEFMLNLGRMLRDGLPIFIGVSLVISTLSAIVGLKESWTFAEAQYFGYITALTVGYGDVRPTTGLGRFLAIVIALFGFIATGLMVAIAVETAAVTFEQRQALALS